MKKELKRIIRELLRQGFEVERTSKGHYRVYLDGVWVTTLPGRRVTGGPSRTRWQPPSVPGSSGRPRPLNQEEPGQTKCPGSSPAHDTTHRDR